MGLDHLVGMDELARTFGIKSDRWLFALLKTKGVLDYEREPLPPYKYQGYFQIKEVAVKMGQYTKTVPRTFVTQKGVTFISGVICGAREAAPAMGHRDPAAAGQKRTTESAEPGAQAS